MRQLINDLPEVFSGFDAAAIFFSWFSAQSPTWCYCTIWGFYIAGAIYLVCTLLGLKVRPVPPGLHRNCNGRADLRGLYLFLKVPLPGGVLFS